MTLAFALLTLGSALMYTSFTDNSIAGLLRGNPGRETNLGGKTDVTLEAEGKGSGPWTAAGEIAAGTKGTNTNLTGVGTYDGKPVAKWIIPWLQRSKRAGWKGSVTSGYRTPEESDAICHRMCRQPSCPGTCAGRSSNHSGKKYPAGAVDVSDYTNFARIQRQIGSPLKNSLGASDPVHFSVSGS